MLIDSFARRHKYLRLAVTDRCNLRCRYCMPAEGIAFAPKDELLSYEEMLRLTALLRKRGLEKVRITGGEPLARRDIMFLLRGLVNQGLKVHLTTNAVLLHRVLDELIDLPLSGLNVSLDSLRADRFAAITRRDEFGVVWQNLEAAMETDIPTKLNVVTMEGTNDDELLDFAALAEDRPLSVRFIEAMPFNAGDGNRRQFLSADKIMERLLLRYPELQPAPIDPNAAAMRYVVPGWRGSIGVIPAYSRSLCGSCNRLRITPKGSFLSCLYTTKGLELLPLLRHGVSDEEIGELIEAYLKTKAVNGHEAERLSARDGSFASMTTIGG